MTDLTVVCFLWNGWRSGTYSALHVNTLEYMVATHLKTPHKFVCVTDSQEGINCNTLPIWQEPQISTGTKQPNSYRRLRLFSPEAKSMFGRRVLAIDLDCAILKNIDSLITEDDFKIVEGKAAPFNGSMFLHTTGTHTSVWVDFNRHSPDIVQLHARKTGVKHYGSDQGWMSYKLEGSPTWGDKDGVYHYTLLNNKVPEDARIVFTAGSIKPWMKSMAMRCPELHRAYYDAVQASGAVKILKT